MKKQSILLFPVIISLTILVACSSHSTPTPEPAGIPSSIPTPASSATVKKVDLVNNYVIEIPGDFTVQELLSSPITTVPTYNFETPTGSAFSIFVLPYMVSSSPIPGKCDASTALDAGTTSAPFFCEGLELTSSFTAPSGWVVKYGNTINDLSLDCTMNSPCPMNVPPESRYSISYVFVIADKPRAATLEFYAGDAFRSSSTVINGFEGLAGVLHDLIIPSLSIRNP